MNDHIDRRTLWGRWTVEHYDTILDLAGKLHGCLSYPWRSFVSAFYPASRSRRYFNSFASTPQISPNPFARGRFLIASGSTTLR